MVKNASAAGTPTRTPPEELTALPKPHSWTKCRGGLGKGKKIGWKERRDNEREMRERKMEREEKVTGVAYVVLHAASARRFVSALWAGVDECSQ